MVRTGGGGWTEHPTPGCEPTGLGSVRWPDLFSNAMRAGPGWSLVEPNGACACRERSQLFPPLLTPGRQPARARGFLVDREGFADAPQRQSPGARPVAASADEARHLTGAYDRLRRQDRCRVGELLDARGDIDGKAEIILPVIEHHCKARPLVDARRIVGRRVTGRPDTPASASHSRNTPTNRSEAGSVERAPRAMPPVP